LSLSISIAVAVAIDHHMAITQVEVGKNIVEDVLLDGRSNININIKNLLWKLGLSQPKLDLYNFKMVNQTTTKLVGLIKDLKIFIHEIPYTMTFTRMQNNLLDSTYFITIRNNILCNHLICNYM
jgi:hypothetical protein